MSDDLTADELLDRAVRAQEQIAANYAEVLLCHQADRRERIATAALQGLLAYLGNPDGIYELLASHAVAYADALIAELDKEGGR